MLLRFGFENYRSIGAYQNVLLTTSGQNVNDYLFSSPAVRERIVPIVAIYGANASGKTNVIRALRCLHSSVLNSTSKDFKFRYSKFKLSKDYKESPSTFDIDFILDDVHYHYGYIIENGKVVEEWLYSFTYTVRMARTVLFQRTDDGSEYYFGKALKGFNKIISATTDENTLFLSQGANMKHELFVRIARYFENNILFRFSSDINENSVGELILNNSLEKSISRFISSIDIGAASLKVTKSKRDDKQKMYIEKIANAFSEVLGDEKQFLKNIENTYEFEHKIHLYRYDDDKKVVRFKYDDESLGTQSLISILASIFKVLQHGGVFVVDELESSLHTLLSQRVVQLFNCRETNPNNAQLIFTTHDTQLLNFEGIVRDEVWLTEKSKGGSTIITPLSDFSINKKSNIRNGYLDGRFGAIPFLSSIDDFKLFED